MKLLYTFCISSILIQLTACQSGEQRTDNQNMDFKQIPVTYPATRKDTTVSDTYFGQKINDPYRWLEDDQSAETKEWVTRQNIVTNGYLSQIPFREQVKSRMEKVINYERFGAPFKEGGKYYYFKNDGLQNQSVLYVQQNLNDQSETVLDPNQFSADGTTSLGELNFSKDGRYLAYTMSKGGSDWRTIVVKDLQTGQMLNDRLEWAKFTALAWHGNGFYYTRYPTPKKGDELKGANQFGAVYFHELGTDQSADKLVYSDKAHPDRSFGASTTEDERFMIVSGFETTSGNVLYFKDLSKPKSEFTPISTTFENDFSVVDNIGSKLLVLTNQQAPNQRLILIDS
ncbi:MAG: S9 family peptidase, partial [Saprospiraceae bacterium]|nr:S9 family peptidase [Saprospiraceae bacterium]